MSVRYTAYKLISADGSMLVDANMQGDISVKQNVIKQVLADLQSFAIGGKSENTSQLGIDWEGQNYAVSRDYRNHKLDIQPQLTPEIATKFADWKNNFIVVPSELNPQIQSQLVATIEKFGEGAAPAGNEEEIKQGIVTAGGELGTKYIEIKQKIQALEAELGTQKRMDENVLSLGELETALKQIEEQIASVHSLLEKQTQINQTLVKYGQLAQRDLEAEGAKLREQLEKLRQQELVAFSHDQGFDPVAASKITESHVKREGWHASYLAILGVITILIGFAAFAFTKNPLLIMFSALVAIVEFGLFGTLNYIPSQVDVKNIFMDKDQGTAGALVQPEQTENQGLIAKLEKFFVDKAWISALKSESKYMTDTISTKLNGKNVDELQTAQTNLKGNIEILKAEIEKFKANEISPQDYLQKRRELDMLSIDKARAERDLRNAPNGEKVMELVTQLSEQGAQMASTSLTLDDKLAESLGIKSVSLANGIVQFELSDGTLQPSEEVEQNSMLGVILWYRLQEWQKDIQVPLVLVEPLTGWANTFKVLVDNKLSELRTLGQIVRIQLLP